MSGFWPTNIHSCRQDSALKKNFKKEAYEGAIVTFEAQLSDRVFWASVGTH